MVGASGQDAFQSEPLDPPGLPGLKANRWIGPMDDEIGQAWMALSILVRWAAPQPKQMTFIPAGQTTPAPEYKACSYCHVLQDLLGGVHLDGCIVGDADRLLTLIARRATDKFRSGAAVAEFAMDAALAACQPLAAKQARWLHRRAWRWDA